MPATTLPPKDYAIAPQRGLPLLVLWAILATVAALPPAFSFAERGAAGLAQAGTWLGPGLVLLTGLGMSLAYRRQRIRLDAAGLDIRSTFYRKAVALAALQLERARIVDLAEHAELKPSLKTNGYNLPGFRSGHFRLSGGGKAFCLITDHQRVLVLPLHDGSTLLLSPEHPAQLLRDLQVLAAAGQRH